MSETSLRTVFEDNEASRKLQNSTLFLNNVKGFKNERDDVEDEAKEMLQNATFTFRSGDNSIKKDKTKLPTFGIDCRSLLWILCLLTFEADYPEEFYDSLAKSRVMTEILSNLKPKGLSASIQDMS